MLYGDRITDSMRYAIDETNRRRGIQEKYNKEHGITPETILKPIDESLLGICEADYMDVPLEEEAAPEGLQMDRFASMEDLDHEVGRLEKRMKKAAEKLDFEEAAGLRDQISWLRKHAVFS